jgi:hypothetical protein
MRKAGIGMFLLAAVGLISSGAAADDQQSFTALVAKGFEVKSVVLVPLEVGKRASKNVTTDTIIVTLQNSTSVAVCYVAFANWAFMNKASLDTTTLCEVR